VVGETKIVKKSGIIIKIDYEKAYDSVSWNILYYTMGRVGFCAKWIGWIRACLKYATIFILDNGSSTQKINSSKGLRQEDPMTPFLLLIVVAGMVRQTSNKNIFEGIIVEKNNVQVELL